MKKIIFCLSFFLTFLVAKNHYIKSLLILLLLGSMQIEARDTSSVVKLEKGEKKFKNIKSYQLKDFNFAWNIEYMDIVEYTTNESDGIHFSLPSKVKFYKVFKVGNESTFSHRRQVWLAKALLKKDYFWKNPIHPSAMYAFTTMRFLENGDARFKAVSELKDVQDMFGAIDTEAELYIWLVVTRAGYPRAYSYRKEGNLYRVRFAGVNPFSCIYEEYFKYYNKYGKVIKVKKLKNYRKKGCSVIIM